MCEGGGEVLVPYKWLLQNVTFWRSLIPLPFKHKTVFREFIEMRMYKHFWDHMFLKYHTAPSGKPTSLKKTYPPIEKQEGVTHYFACLHYIAIVPGIPPTSLASISHVTLTFASPAHAQEMKPLHYGNIKHPKTLTFCWTRSPMTKMIKPNAAEVPPRTSKISIMMHHVRNNTLHLLPLG